MPTEVGAPVQWVKNSVTMRCLVFDESPNHSFESIQGKYNPMSRIATRFGTLKSQQRKALVSYAYGW